MSWSNSQVVFKVPGVAIKERQIFWTVKFRELKEHRTLLSIFEFLRQLNYLD